MNQIKKGIRCETGAVPAAVSSIRQLADCFIESEATVPTTLEWEGINKRNKPEDLPQFNCK